MEPNIRKLTTKIKTISSDSSNDGNYKLTTLIKNCKQICDVLLVFICYNYKDDLQKSYPIIGTIQTIVLIFITILLNDKDELFTSTSDNPNILQTKETLNNFNHLIEPLRTFVLNNPNIKSMLETCKHTDNVTILFEKIYRYLYIPLNIIDVFEESDNPDKEARSISFKFLIVVGIYFLSVVKKLLLNPLTRFLILTFFPDILNLDFDQFDDKYSLELKQHISKFSVIKSGLEAGSNIKRSLYDTLLFIIQSNKTPDTFDKTFFIQQFSKRFPEGLVIPDTVGDYQSGGATSNKATISGGRRRTRHISVNKKIEKIKYSNINQFIDIHSLMGMFMLHNYNKYT